MGGGFDVCVYVRHWVKKLFLNNSNLWYLEGVTTFMRVVLVLFTKNGRKLLVQCVFLGNII